MSDFDERLRALDPAAGQPYHHHDLDGMITRITRQRVAAPSPVWRRFQLKMAGALAASALLTVGAIAALQGAGTVLPLLALQSTNTGGAPSANPQTFMGTMQVYEQYHFSAASALTPTTPTSSSYELQFPSDQSAEAMRVAAIFGVTKSPLTISGDNHDTTITDSSGRSLDYESTGLPQWYYSFTSPSIAPATATDSSNAQMPSHATLEGDVSSYLTKLDYGYTVSSPDFTTSTVTNTSSDGTTEPPASIETVTYIVDVAGIATDEPVVFEVDANNDVIYASGPAFSVNVTSNYPLQSPIDGVAALNAEQQSRFSASSSASSSTSSEPPANSGAGVTGSTSGPPIVEVTLSSDSVSLQTYELADGTSWLLPVYHYVGQSTNADGTLSTSSWYELAVDPRYVQMSSNSSGSGSHGPINY